MTNWYFFSHKSPRLARAKEAVNLDSAGWGRESSSGNFYNPFTGLATFSAPVSYCENNCMEEALHRFEKALHQKSAKCTLLHRSGWHLQLSSPASASGVLELKLPAMESSQQSVWIGIPCPCLFSPRTERLFLQFSGLQSLGSPETLHNG